MALNIFFSHGTRDREWVQDIASKIENQEIDVYFYERDSQPGRLVSDKLQRAIERCDMAIVLITRRSYASAYVQQEVGYAEGAKKLVIPLLEKGTPKKALGMLEGREYIPFNRDSMDETVAALTSYLVKHLATTGQKGLSRDQIIDLLLALLLLVLAGYLLYSVLKD